MWTKNILYVCNLYICCCDVIESLFVNSRSFLFGCMEELKVNFFGLKKHRDGEACDA